MTILVQMTEGFFVIAFDCFAIARLKSLNQIIPCIYE